jgi:leucyl-tRNA synthetase
MRRYNPKEIEPKWQEIWETSGINKAADDKMLPKKYVLEYFPYPSGAAMHVGHVRNYTIGDAVSRYSRMNGFNVLHPMGWDGFGLPAENYAIKNNISPRKAINENTKKFKQQLMQMGFSYDWSREIDSTDPSYYKWTQWLFLMLYKKGLAYQKESLQWWCPFDKTVLANEQVEDGRCWRCGNLVEKKALKQWFFKITDYADRLADDLDKVDWPDAIKHMQRNWIGKSKGAEIEFKVDGTNENIKVFTTRPDTIFGATFLVIAPEHPILNKLSIPEHQKNHVLQYVRDAERKSEIERMETEREKTGVFTGLYAINPANNEEIPIWVADYVLGGYGTGAIMSVPAHDERDFEFASKFEIPVVPVVAQNFGEPVPNATYVEGSFVIGYDRNTSKFMGLKNGDKPWLVGGGREENETFEEAALREIGEEAGYHQVDKLIALGDPFFTNYFNPIKQIGRKGFGYCYLAIMDSAQPQKTNMEEHESFSVKWQDYGELYKSIEELNKTDSSEHWLDGLRRARQVVGALEAGQPLKLPAYTGEGILINSGKYNGMSTAEARDKIISDLAKASEGKEKVNYKIRDWLISRQRYWGAPIPMVHCVKDGIVPVPEDQLPVVLPELEKFEPIGDGRSPLAGVPDFVNTTCPKCGGPAERETDTMDGFACSSWYFLRFVDPHNNKQAFSRQLADLWLPVDDYIGGAEHAVMHLLYARFWTKVMFDEGLIGFDEPFSKLRNHGMILAPDGQKMSKSKGNTIEPDFLLNEGYGADSIRLMELFIGPWDQAASWSTQGLSGMYRFLQRVWTLTAEFLEAEHQPQSHLEEADLMAATHKTIKAVTQDVEKMEFNTAIAAMMGLVNELYKHKADKGIYQSPGWRSVIENLLQILAPFAPHITEELWRDMDHEESIHVSRWPQWDEELTTDALVTIVVQVNGKVRAEIVLGADISEADAIKEAKANDKVMAYIEGKEIKKAIYVPGRLVSLVI